MDYSFPPSRKTWLLDALRKSKRERIPSCACDHGGSPRPTMPFFRRRPTTVLTGSHHYAQNDVEDRENTIASRERLTMAVNHMTAFVLIFYGLTIICRYGFGWDPIRDPPPPSYTVHIPGLTNAHDTTGLRGSNWFETHRECMKRRCCDSEIYARIVIVGTFLFRSIRLLVQQRRRRPTLDIVLRWFDLSLYSQSR